MRISFYILILSLFIFSCHNEINQDKEIIIEEDTITEIDDYGENECISNEVDTLNKKFPFSESSKIVIHSFEPVYETRYFSTIKNDTFYLNGIEESIDLSENEINELYQILFGYRTKRIGNTSSEMACYDPHHCIVFYQENRPIEFLEICIECESYRTHKRTHIDFCEEKWCNLFNYFQSIDIKKTTRTLENRCKKDAL